ncbi:hypothetical protein V1506DRAFT_578265 [Lipomyces tetrasporus]
MISIGPNQLHQLAALFSALNSSPPLFFLLPPSSEQSDKACSYSQPSNTSQSSIVPAEPSTVGQPAVSSNKAYSYSKPPNTSQPSVVPQSHRLSDTYIFGRNSDTVPPTVGQPADPAGEAEPKFPPENERPLKKPDHQIQTQRLADIQPQTTVQQEQQKPLRRTILQPKSCRELRSRAPIVAQLASKLQTSTNTSIASNKEPDQAYSYSQSLASLTPKMTSPLYKLPQPRLSRRAIASRIGTSSGDISDTAPGASHTSAAPPTVGQPAVSPNKAYSY